ncbi:VOC family protein [Pseudonocardia sp. GCM10023141]|uniref:VOC family protein n=1 Tax=Pseudonocardia sp. GCM10023141 TaxID=3252653 RepID=UPI00361F3A49
MEIRGMYPKLVVEGADAALAFYTAAFGAKVLERFTEPGGRVVHAMAGIGDLRFAVKDAGDGDPAPSGGGVPVIMALEVTDADAVAERMLAAGATVIYPVADHDYGDGARDRGGRLADPFGHQWMVAAPPRT